MACTSAATTEEPAEPPAPAPASTPAATTPAPTTPASDPSAKPPTASAVTVQMTAATLADDCGGGATAAKAKAKRSDSAGARTQRMAKAKAKTKTACQQTSMQLSVVAAADTPRAQLSVTKVELLDDKGALLGELSARTPTVWSEGGAYQAWDEGISGGQELSVSYALSEPPWGEVSDRWNRTYVLKAALTIDGDEQLVRREVEVAAPTILPPNVKT